MPSSVYPSRGPIWLTCLSFFAVYVGLATVAGFIWWFVYSDGGPKLTYSELVRFYLQLYLTDYFINHFFHPLHFKVIAQVTDHTFHIQVLISLKEYVFTMFIWQWIISFQMNFETCALRETTYPCSIFEDRHPSTVAMTVLVVVEMFNALNNLSENQSLL